MSGGPPDVDQFATMTAPDFHLDVYLNGIREKFNHLNKELDEARNQRDEYKRNCIACFRNLLVKP